MTEDEKKESWRHISEMLDKATPFKRVQAPQHLLDKYNQLNGINLKKFAVTVLKEVDVTDEMIWEAMTAKVELPENNPPHTGRSKTRLDDDSDPIQVD